MADWNGFKKNGTIYIPNDATARASISTIESKIPNGTTSSNPLVNQSTMENALDGKVDVGDVISLAESVSDIEDKIPSNASSSNQLATRREVSAAYKPKGNATLATLPPLTTTNLNNVYNMTEDFTTTADFAEGAGKEVKAGNEVGIINIATDPDAFIIKYTVLGGFIDLSEYATQASVTSALADKVDKVTGKGLSTNDYDNTAKVIVDNIQDNVIANTKLIKDTVGWSGKNKFKYNRVTVAGSEKTFPFTVNGITFTKNSDDTITVGGGTASANTQAFLWLDGTIKAGDYIVNGCPSGGGSGKYDVRTDNDHKDEGNGVNVTLASDVGNTFYVILTVYNGCNLTNPITFKTMIYDANILDDTYEPYFGSTAFPRSEQAVLGARQLITLPLYETSKSIYTAGINSNGLLECTFNGTASEYTEVQLKNRTSLPMSLPKGRYRIAGGYSLNLYIRIGHTKNGEWESLATSYGDETSEGSDVFTLNDKDNNIGIFYGIQSNIAYDNLKLYPMIVLADDPITEPTPPTMTNAELTANLFTIKNTTSDYTCAAGVTCDAAISTKAGRINMHTLKLSTTDNISAGTTIITGGFGKSDFNYDMQFNTVFRDVTGNEYKISIVTAQSSVQLKTLTAIPNGTSIRGTIFFIEKI